MASHAVEAAASRQAGALSLLDQHRQVGRLDQPLRVVRFAARLSDGQRIRQAAASPSGTMATGCGPSAMALSAEEQEGDAEPGADRVGLAGDGAGEVAGANPLAAREAAEAGQEAGDAGGVAAVLIAPVPRHPLLLAVDHPGVHRQVEQDVDRQHDRIAQDETEPRPIRKLAT